MLSPLLFDVFTRFSLFSRVAREFVLFQQGWFLTGSGRVADALVFCASGRGTMIIPRICPVRFSSDGRWRKAVAAG